MLPVSSSSPIVKSANGEDLLRTRIGAAAAFLAALVGILGVASPTQAASRAISAQDAPAEIQAACSTGPTGGTGSWALCTGSNYSFRASIDCYNLETGFGWQRFGYWKTAGSGQSSYAFCLPGELRTGFSYEVLI